MKFRTLLLCAVAILLCTVVDVAAQSKDKGDPDLDTLLVWLEGSFSSTRQANLDSSYFDIRLHMKRIWRQRTDGAWFYVEQAVATSLDKPYRQRMYRVQRVEEGMLESIVYTFLDPTSVVGGWQDTTKFDGLTPEQLVLRRGCEVYMQATGESFVGSTHGTGCRSDIQGASYATSEVTLYFDRLLSWDRGFNSANEQVWGAKKGPYVFFRE